MKSWSSWETHPRHGTKKRFTMETTPMYFPGQSTGWVEVNPLSFAMGFSSNQLRICHFLQGIWLIGLFFHRICPMIFRAEEWIWIWDDMRTPPRAQAPCDTHDQGMESQEAALDLRIRDRSSSLSFDAEAGGTAWNGVEWWKGSWRARYGKGSPESLAG